MLDDLTRLARLARRTYVALVHHPVYDRNGRVVTTAVTNLDIHDIARASRTYGLAGYFLVTPVSAQRELVSRIVGHWTTGEGRDHNEDRTDALSLVRVVASLEEMTLAIRAAAIDSGGSGGLRPFVVATAAGKRVGQVPVAHRSLCEMRAKESGPMALLFGTGWGLAESVLSSSDALLEPIQGNGSYNHLSVRSAVAIVLDRLFGSRV